MTNLEQVIKKIQKAVPEIMELKENGFIEYKRTGKTEFQKYRIERVYEALLDYQHPDDKESRTIRVLSIFGENTHFNEEIRIHNSGKEFNGKDIKILGRPITLENVLIALDKKDDIAVDQYGRFYCLSPENEYIARTAIWQLGKTLDQQSEETIKFLNEIL